MLPSHINRENVCGLALHGQKREEKKKVVLAVDEYEFTSEKP